MFLSILLFFGHVEPLPLSNVFFLNLEPLPLTPSNISFIQRYTHNCLGFGLSNALRFRLLLIFEIVATLLTYYRGLCMFLVYVLDTQNRLDIYVCYEYIF